jgi:hypothetical protein
VSNYRRPDGDQYSLSVRAFPESVTWHDAQAGLTADDRESLALVLGRWLVSAAPVAVFKVLVQF